MIEIQGGRLKIPCSSPEAVVLIKELANSREKITLAKNSARRSLSGARAKHCKEIQCKSSTLAGFSLRIRSATGLVLRSKRFRFLMRFEPEQAVSDQRPP